MAKKVICPVCGSEMPHCRMWNEDLMGIGKDNPYIGWICQNPECKGWWCDYCEEWHPYGTGCSVAMVRNMRERGTGYLHDPNWRHQESRVTGRKRKKWIDNGD